MMLGDYDHVYNTVRAFVNMDAIAGQWHRWHDARP